MAANWSSLTIDPRDLERNQMVTPAPDQSASFQTNQSEYPNTPQFSFSSCLNAADAQASRMPSALAGPNMLLSPFAIDLSLDPIAFNFNDVMRAQVDTHCGWSGQAGYEETTHFQQNAGHSLQCPLPSFVFPSYQHDPSQGPQEFNLESQGLIVAQPPAKSPPRQQMGYSVPPPTGPKMQQQPDRRSTGVSFRSSEKRRSRATIDRKLKSRRRPMAQKQVPHARGAAQGKHINSDGASSQSTTSSSECSTNIDELKAHTPMFQEAIAMVQESIKPFSPPFRRKAAALIDQVAELVKQLNQVAIDEELYGNQSSDVEVDTQPSIASSSDDYISNPELMDSESNTDDTSVSSIPRQLVVEDKTPAFAEVDQQGPIHSPCAQCGVKTLYFCTRQDKKTKKPCRYAHHVLAEWKRHMKTQKHSQRERFMCLECPNSPPAIDINGHSVCQFCEESFPTLGANLRAHYTQCQSAKRANKSYGRQDKLIDHLRSHPGVINLSLTAATGKYTVNSEWPDECGFCGKTFSSFKEMLDDIAKHFQAGLNMSSWKRPFPPSKDSHLGFQPHSKGDDSESDDDIDDNKNYPSHQSSGSRTKEASSFSSSGQSKRSNGNQRSGSSYQGGRRRCCLVPQAIWDNSAEPIGSHSSSHATTSVALERYLSDEEEPVELGLGQVPSSISSSSPMFNAVATEDDLVSNVPDLDYVMHSLILQEHKGCVKKTIPSTERLQVPSIGSSVFGFGIGDFLPLGQLAPDVFNSCKTASEDLKNLPSEIPPILEILQSLRALQSDHSLPEWNHVLQNVQAQAEKRKSFKSDRNHMFFFDRLKWGKPDIDGLIARWMRNRAMFEIFMMTAGPSSGVLQSALTLAKLRQITRQGACMCKNGTEQYDVTNYIGEVFTGNGNETHTGLIVTDGAVISTALGVNLTMTMLAERSVKYTARRRISQNINMEPNDVLDLFGSSHQINIDKQILHHRDTYRISEGKDLIRATRAANSNGFSFSEVMSGYIYVKSCLKGYKMEDYQTAAQTGKGLCEEARSSLSMKAYSLRSIAPVRAFVPHTPLPEKLREQLCRELDNDRKREPKNFWLQGLGGIGKSQLALSYLQRYGADYKATFWIQAGQTVSVVRDFLEIHYLLFWNTPLQSHQIAPEVVRREVLNWFTRDPAKWLGFFDGANQLHRKDQGFMDPRRYIPSSPNTHIIITSCSTIARKFSIFEGVHVNEKEETQAIDFSLKCAEISSRETKTEAEVKAIVKELGCLPLAIMIAGTYVSQAPRLSSHLPAYLEEYRRRRQAEQPDDLIDEHGHSVMTTWEISYAAVCNQLPEACQLLTLLAFIIDEDIFLDFFVLKYYSSFDKLQALQASTIGTKSTFTIDSPEKSFAILERYSLFQRDTNHSSYSMHSLVYAWNFDRLQQKNKSDIKNFCPAALQLRFLKKSTDPKERLTKMLQVNAASRSSTKELDEMYTMVLKNLITKDNDEDNEDVATLFKEIVGYIIVILFDTLSIRTLAKLLAVSSFDH